LVQVVSSGPLSAENRNGPVAISQAGKNGARGCPENTWLSHGARDLEWSTCLTDRSARTLMPTDEQVLEAHDILDATGNRLSRRLRV
jgi:hypothetical protein